MEFKLQKTINTLRKEFYYGTLEWKLQWGVEV